MAEDVDPGIPVVFLDTGWLFEETLAYRDTLIATLGLGDVRSIKPLDEATLRDAAEATDGRLVTVEDHWAEGGLGDAVISALADTDDPPRVVKLAVREMPKSARSEELLARSGIDAEHIARAARQLVAQTAQTA